MNIEIVIQGVPNVEDYQIFTYSINSNKERSYTLAHLGQ